MITTTPVTHIGVGIDTARSGHRVTFLRDDRQPAAPKTTPPGTMHMSAKGSDLVRRYLWNAAKSAVQHNGALGHCIRKLLHQLFGVSTRDTAAKTGLPLYEAALDLAETFHIPTTPEQRRGARNPNRKPR